MEWALTIARIQIHKCEMARVAAAASGYLIVLVLVLMLIPSTIGEDTLVDRAHLPRALPTPSLISVVVCHLHL